MFNRKSIRFLALSASLALTACGGSSGGDSNPVGGQGGENGGNGGTVITPTNKDNFRFMYQSDFADASEEVYLDFIDDTIGIAVAPLNEIPNVFNEIEIPVIYGNCGQANAFYSPSTRQVFLCDELLNASYSQFLTLFADAEDPVLAALGSAVGLMNFVLYHEMGHALDDLRDLGIGGNFESVADAIGVVLSVRTGQPEAAIFASLLFLEDTEGSVLDVHTSGADRAGDILCWTIGSSSRLSAQFSDVADALVAAGRDCVGEYADQFDFVSRLIPNLTDMPPISSLRSEKRSEDDHIAIANAKIAALLSAQGN